MEDDKKKFDVKAWGGVNGRVLGKCKYCKSFSFAEVMLVDPEDKKPYHSQCKEKHDREIADSTHNMTEETNN